MIEVYGVRPSAGGFGEYVLTTGRQHYDLDTIQDYLDFVASEPDDVDLIRIDDEDWREVEGMRERIHDRDDGKLVGWRDQDGDVIIEVVFEG